MEGLKSIVPAVRFDFNAFALYGGGGLVVLESILQFAKACGYYVLLDGIATLSAQSADYGAQILLSPDCKWYYDGLVITAYIGSDGIRPYAEKLNVSDKDLFVVARTANRTAPEIQDLLTGSRLAHMAMTDIINRFAEPVIGRCGYSRVAVMAAASSADSLRALRKKYTHIFMLLDGCDYPNANAKNCSFAFDGLGHGAIACVGLSVTAAWIEDDYQGNYVAASLNAVERIKRNLMRYLTIL